MKNTELDTIRNLILDIGLTLNQFIKEQREVNARYDANFVNIDSKFDSIDKKIERLGDEQSKTNLITQQLNLSVMKLAEKTKRLDYLEERIKKIELNH